MPKRNRAISSAKLMQWHNDCRGQGEGQEYKPWLTIQDVPSRGVSARIHGIKTNRQHEFLSDLEAQYFYTLEFSPFVIDIREQFPLTPVERTISIANELGIKHPADPSTGVNIVMTTDFMVTIKRSGIKSYLARTLKYHSDLENYRTLEKFDIERRFWETMGIDWGIVTEKDIDRTFADNIKILHPFLHLESISNLSGISLSHLADIANLFKAEISGKTIVLRDASSSFDTRMMLPYGTSLSLYKHLLMTRQINVDLRKRLDVDNPVTINPVTIYKEVFDENIRQSGASIQI